MGLISRTNSIVPGAGAGSLLVSGFPLSSAAQARQTIENPRPTSKIEKRFMASLVQQSEHFMKENSCLYMKSNSR